ncbi:MAG: 30S ribosomal protein S15 [Chloroflexi bacterium]|nr:30S ribosomal protein S15 [Chloroflexota bacterium]
MLTTEQKQGIVSKYGRDGNDTGSSEVQIALLTSRIQQLSAHMGENKHDKHSEMGLLKLVGRRRRLMRYLHRRNPAQYRTLIAELGLRG